MAFQVRIQGPHQETSSRQPLSFFLLKNYFRFGVFMCVSMRIWDRVSSEVTTAPSGPFSSFRSADTSGNGDLWAGTLRWPECNLETGSRQFARDLSRAHGGRGKRLEALFREPEGHVPVVLVLTVCFSVRLLPGSDLEHLMMLSEHLWYPWCLSLSLFGCFWRLLQAIKNDGSCPWRYLNLDSVKWVLTAQKPVPFCRSRKNMETVSALPFTFDWYFSLWKLIITNVKEKWDSEIWVIFMNFHFENLGHLFSFLIPQFTHQLSILSGGRLVTFLWLWLNTWESKL